MRSLSASLLAAQRSPSRRPYVKVEVVGRIGGVARLAWDRLYQGSEPDFFHAAAMGGDGSLLRARVDPADYKLYFQRVTAPGPGSDFGSWSQLTTVSSVSGIALSSYGATVLLFYVDTDQKSIYVRQSDDWGASFGAQVLIVTADSAVGWLAADFKDGGVVALFYSVGGEVYAVKRTGGAWGSPALWSNSLAAVTGLAAVYQGDWNLAVSGSDSSSDYGVWACLYGDGHAQPGDTWSSLAELTLASAGSGVEFHCPFMDLPDVFRLLFVEKYTGTAAYSRPLWCHSLPGAEFVDNLWREPVPFDLSSTYGMAIASGISAWLSTPQGVWQAALTPASVEVTSDILELVAWAGPTSGRIRVELRNDDGRYRDIGSGDLAAIEEGSELAFSPGYHTGAGPEVSAGPACWIEGWEYGFAGGTAHFAIQAEDGWGLLERWRARRQFDWAGGTRNIFQLLSFIHARAGLKFGGIGMSGDMVNRYPAFTIHPGESGGRAVRRLLDMVPDVLFFRGNGGYVKSPQASDDSDYSYGGDHPLVRGSYSSAPFAVNRVQVYGDGVMAESFAWEQISKVYDRLRQVHDLNLDTTSQAQQRGQAELRRQSLAHDGGEIVVPANCGQELYDVVDISDERAGLTGAKRRLLGLSLHYSTRGRRARYEHRLDLGGV